MLFILIIFDIYYSNYDNCRGMKRSYRLDDIYYNSNNNDNIHLFNTLLMLFAEGFSKV